MNAQGRRKLLESYLSSSNPIVATPVKVDLSSLVGRKIGNKGMKSPFPMSSVIPKFKPLNMSGLIKPQRLI